MSVGHLYVCQCGYLAQSSGWQRDYLERAWKIHTRFHGCPLTLPPAGDFDAVIETGISNGRRFDD
jgi:hypothetical protein